MYWLLVVRADLYPQRGDLSVLKGLRIGAAPGVDLGLHRLLAEAGIDVERDGVRIGPVPGATDAGVSFGVTAAKALEAHTLDGFWANAMGAEVAVRRGVGTVVLDVRRGDGPPGAQGYTFPAFVTTERRIAEAPDEVWAAVRALVRTQQALRDAPQRATAVGQKLFPAMEASLIAELIRRDLPYYDATISEPTVASLNRFAQDVGLLTQPVPYEQVVATQFSDLWKS
jgi:ABC-type nitrate/sulfonate/bicarbonate transport system substrate-binding protein